MRVVSRMKKILFIYLLIAFFSPITAKANTGLDGVKKDNENLWAGTGAQDATATAVSMSMVGWGLGLAGGIAILASAIHQSSSSHDTSSCSH